MSRMFLLYCEDLRSKLTLEARHVEPFNLDDQYCHKPSFATHYDQAYLMRLLHLILKLTGL